MVRRRSARPASETYLGIDLGATKVATAVVDSGGRILAHSGRVLHSNEGPDAVIRHVLESARTCTAKLEASPRGVGVGVAGQVDHRTESVRYAPNLRWVDVPLGPTLSQALGLPVSLLNDAKAATVGEWRHGAGQGCEDIVCLFVGTGIGSGVVSGDRLLDGASGATGEVGHMTLVAGGRSCTCPNRGCLEAYAGGWAIAQRAREAIELDPAAGSALLAHAKDLENVDGKVVGELARQGDPLALRIFEETLGYFGAGMVAVVNAFNPARVIVGGGVADGWPELLTRAAADISAHCQPPAAKAATVLPASLGERAGIIGAATWARERATRAGGD